MNAQAQYITIDVYFDTKDKPNEYSIIAFDNQRPGHVHWTDDLYTLVRPGVRVMVISHEKCVTLQEAREIAAGYMDYKNTGVGRWRNQSWMHVNLND